MIAEATIPQIVQSLERDNLLPAIVFRTARAQCDNDVERAAASPKLVLSKYGQSSIRDFVHQALIRFDVDSSLVLDHPHYGPLVRTGVGAHHAGQLLVWRLLLEELMAAGLLRVLVATGTVAAGVDFPARTVVITADSRRGGNGYSNLTASEFQQMSGRAGRRGKDTVGFCLAAPSKFCDPRAILKVARKHPEPLQSAYYPGPSTILNLLRYRNIDDLRYTVERSLAAFVDRREAAAARLEAAELEAELVEAAADAGDHDPKNRKRLRKKQQRLLREADDLDVRQSKLLDLALGGLAGLGYVDQSGLSEKGYWASNICTNLVLELSEVIASGMLDGAPAEKMIAIVAALCGEEHRKLIPEDAMRDFPLEESELKALADVAAKVRKYNLPGLADSLFVARSAAVTALLWHRASDWSVFRGILNLSNVQEGDAARLITQAAEQLNQLSKLYETHSVIADTARYCRGKLLRPPLTELVAV